MRRWVTGIGVVVLAAACALGAATPEKKRDSYVDKVRSKLDHWGAQVQQVQRESEKAGQKSRVVVQEHARTFEDLMQEARRKLENLRSTAGSEWEKLRPDVDHAVEDVRRSYRKLIKEKP